MKLKEIPSWKFWNEFASFSLDPFFWSSMGDMLSVFFSLLFCGHTSTYGFKYWLISIYFTNIILDFEVLDTECTR